MGFLIADFGMTKVERRIQRAIFCASGFVIISSFELCHFFIPSAMPE